MQTGDIIDSPLHGVFRLIKDNAFDNGTLTREAFRLSSKDIDDYGELSVIWDQPIQCDHNKIIYDRDDYAGSIYTKLETFIKKEIIIRDTDGKKTTSKFIVIYKPNSPSEYKNRGICDIDPHSVIKISQPPKPSKSYLKKNFHKILLEFWNNDYEIYDKT